MFVAHSATCRLLPPVGFLSDILPDHVLIEVSDQGLRQWDCREKSRFRGSLGRRDWFGDWLGLRTDLGESLGGARAVDPGRLIPYSAFIQRDVREDVVRGGLCRHPVGVQRKFPGDQGLVDLGIESYLGVPLMDGGANVLGHLAVFDGRHTCWAIPPRNWSVPVSYVIWRTPLRDERWPSRP